jgi:hypothetical protein
MDRPLPKISDIDIASPRCERCGGEGWVCENHPDQPWNEGDPKCCGGAGMPCPCNFINNFT